MCDDCAAVAHERAEADRQAAHYRQEVEAAFRDAFVAAGWGVGHGEMGGLVFQHPPGLTRT